MSKEDGSQNNSIDKLKTSENVTKGTTQLSKTSETIPIDASLESLLTSRERSGVAVSSTTAVMKRVPPGFARQEKSRSDSRSSSSSSTWLEESDEKTPTKTKEVVKSVRQLYKSSTDVALKRLKDNTVLLNVYGLNFFNEALRFAGIGVFHSGVQVYGNEWAYGSFPLPISSIFMMNEPRDIRSLSDISGRFNFVKSIFIGKTQFTREEVVQILGNMGREDWMGTKYHLLNKNCNHFSNELCKTLCNQGIPSWVNHLACVATSFPFLIDMLPAEFFTPVALQNKLQQEQQLKYNLSTKMITKKKRQSRA